MIEKITKNEWFDEWFNSPYYHILYRHRDDQDAAHFLENIIRFLKLNSRHKILDLACGKGRHSIYLNKKGFDVIGVDLSEANIQKANIYANNRLTFIQKDMRNLGFKKEFDFVLNLFTSFGYFEDDQENEKVIKQVAKSLNDGGVLFLDFLNPAWVVNKLVSEETKTIDGIDFHIERREEDGYIVKDIRFQAEGKDYGYQERVKAITCEEFKHYFISAGLMLEEIFGDYDLNSFDESSSERMIFVARKS